MEVRSTLLTVLCCTVFDLVLGQQAPGELSQKLVRCARKNTSDRGFNQCLRDTMEELRALMTVGFPEFGIDPVDPLIIKNINFATKPDFVPAQAVNVVADLSNVRVEGLRHFITEEIIADRVERTLKLRIRVPRVRVVGHYKAQGKALVITLDGEGPFNANLTNAVGTGFGRIVTVGPPNDRRLSVRDTNIDFQIGGLQIHLDNLFGGKYPALAASANKLLNDRSQDIIREVKPQIKFEVERLFESVMSRAFAELPIEEFLTQLPVVPRASRNVRPPPAGQFPLRGGSNRRQQFVRQGRRGFSG